MKLPWKTYEMAWTRSMKKSWNLFPSSDTCENYCRPTSPIKKPWNCYPPTTLHHIPEAAISVTYKYRFSVPTLQFPFSHCSRTHMAQHSILVFLIVKPRPQCEPLSMAWPVYNISSSRMLGKVVRWSWTVSIRNLRLLLVISAAAATRHHDKQE